MNLIIDLELNQVVQGWGNRNPTDPIVVKSQDTPVMAIYFGKGQASYDLGASPGVRFALYVLGSPNALVDQSGFVRNVDSQNKTAYVAYPNFNTTQMQAAMAGLASMQAVGEVRYQTPFGTIARTLDIPFTVNRSLLQESAFDTTTAAFTVPAVNATVTLHVNHTGWLAPNQNITIGNGAGAYQVVSVTNPTDFVAKNLGGTSNAAPATVIPTGTTVGNTPTSALGVYPDPSTIELLTHKNQPNGYAGLNGSSKLAGSTLPVDGSTIVVNAGGNLASAAILAITNANFTTPAANATVSVTFVSTSGLLNNIYVRIPIAGYYLVQSVTDSTHAVLQNVGDPFNAIAGTTITSGAPLLPAQAVSGGGGTAGPPGPTGPAGVSAFTTTIASFTMPTSGATVTINVAATAWMAQGQNLFIPNAGYFSVSTVIDGAHVVLTNSGTIGNAPAGTLISSGAQVSPAGAVGATGTTGAPGPPGGIGEAPTDGQTYGRKNSAWTPVTSGGGSPVFDPATGEYHYTDFYQTGNGYDSIYVSTSGGTGAAVSYLSTYGQDTTKKVNGCAELWVGTAGTGGAASVSRGSQINNGTNIIGATKYGLGALTFKTRVFFEGTLPPTGIQYIFRAGMAQTLNSTIAYNFTPIGGYGSTQAPFGFNFCYVPDQNSGQWFIECGGASPTVYNSTIAVVGDTAYDLEFDINAAWTQVLFYINGTLVATVTTGIPTTQGAQYISMCRGTGSTNYKVAVDYAMMNYQFTR